MRRIILHSDMNSCFASIECLYEPSLRGKPVSVCGSAAKRHGIVLASTIEAKKFGVRTGETIWQAKQKCPSLITVEPHYDRYLRFSKLANSIYSDYTDLIEPFGLDESFLDVTGNVNLSDDGMKLADEIRRRVKFELGVTVSVGVSYNKVFAKLGSDLKKPDAVTGITERNYRDTVWPLPARNMLLVGPSSEEKLRHCGIFTIGDIAARSEKYMRSKLGRMGETLWCFANGFDRSPVARNGEKSLVKSIGNGTTPPRDLKSYEDARILFGMLSESVAERLREHGLRAHTVQIFVRDADLHILQRQRRMERSTDLSSEICAAAMELLAESCDPAVLPVRSLTIRTCDLVPADAPIQLSVFEDEPRRIKAEKLERAMDELRRRFGHGSISRAVTLLDPTLGHIDARHENVSYPVGFFSGGRSL